MKIEQVVALHEEELMRIPGVNGVGIGERQGKPVILVMLDRPASDVTTRIPSHLDGFPVEIEVIGEVTAY
jgi:hypothetical protein